MVAQILQISEVWGRGLMKSKLFLDPWGSHCGDHSLDSQEGKAELHPQRAALEPGIPGAGMGQWGPPVLLASPYHDFEQALGGLLLLVPVTLAEQGCMVPGHQLEVSHFPRPPLGSRSPPRAGPDPGEFLGSACLKLLTLLGVSSVVRAGTVTGCTWTSWAGSQTATQGHSLL